MKLRLLYLYDTLADSFWFLPALMALLAGGAALGTVALDHEIGRDWAKHLVWIWSGGANGARGVLSVVAGSIMTVISIVFSITIIVLQETSMHFGPRVLRNFTSDRGVQFTLGTFIATFVYCLMVLRTVRSVEESEFVPYLSVNVGVLLALASMAVLIYFIHHVSQSIQAENLIAEVGSDFRNALLTLFPERIGQPKDEASPSEAPDESQWQDTPQVASDKNGYLRRVDEEQLMRLATRYDYILKLEKRPGDFVARGSPLLRVLAPTPIKPEAQKRLCACFKLGAYRTPHQDLLYSIQQLTEIATRALSPSINEPFTALTCIDWLGTALRGVVQRDFPTPLRRDEAGGLRVVANTLDFEVIARSAFDQIRINGASSPEVMQGLLDLIAGIAPDLHRDADRRILIEHARMIGADAKQVANADDRRRVEHHLRETLRALVEGSGKNA